MPWYSKVVPARANGRAPDTILTPEMEGDALRQSTTKTRVAKPDKPRPDFPLFPHATGRWAKKIRGKLVYFGYWTEDPRGDKALAKWLDEKDDLLAGRAPRLKADGLTIRELCDRFMVSRRRKLDSGELAAVSFGDYFQTCRRIIDFFGADRLVTDLAAHDFEKFRASMAKGWGPVTLSNEITRIRVVFKYAADSGLVIDPVKLGTEFKRPKKKVLRASRQAKQRAHGKKKFEAEELRRIVDAADQPLKAMILLAINCGFGNKDIMDIPTKALDLKTGWADFPRPKTAIPRRCPLWPETIMAIRGTIEQRPRPKNASDTALLFVTKYGKPWGTRTIREVKAEDGKEAKLVINSDDPVCKEFNKLLVKLGLKRPGVSFYAIRHTFETVGGGSKDQVAVDAIMGHADDSMAAEYREDIDDARLKAVVEHLHGWLWPKSQETAARTGEEQSANTQ
jgi:integrase